MKRSTVSTAFAAAAFVVAAIGIAPAAHARSDVQFSIGINSPAPVYVEPQPVYVQPAPVYVQPRPVYVQPAPVYAAPPVVYVRPGWREREWRREHWRDERREWKHHHRHWD